ncbi:proteoglycan 4-like [Mizuhopecten yessoensis]|uniref:Uncharacterized protein n=1 Tax=Mizuhopecten yessoensis TaxID=6573 RepID=A0A210Q6U4_MIZYE|nr:proteoglycan 4-like [Mizuhopecten yessoensis]OWF44463.1 hypothetical protein KP79_PYT15081 [Mizuhopecten yessoensis]
MSIPQKRAHAEFESNAVKSNIKEQRRLEKNITVLNVEEAYAMRILNLDSRDINTYRNKMNERTAKIKSHLTTGDIIQMKELEAAGKMKGVNKSPSPSSAIIAAAEKRLNIKPRPKTSLPVRQYNNSRRYSPNIEDNKGDDTNTPSQEEMLVREYQSRSLVKQPSLSNLHQMSTNDSADQDINATWARPSPKPRKRPTTSFVSSNRYGSDGSVEKRSSIPSPVVRIPTAENADDTVSDIEELPNDNTFIPYEEDKDATDQEALIEKPAPSQKYRRLPVTPKRQEVRDSKNEVPTRPEKTHKQTRCPYKGTPMRVVPSATQISMVCNDGTQSTAAGEKPSISRPGSGIPVKTGDIKHDKRRPKTAQHVSTEDRAMELFPPSYDRNEASKDTYRPKTKKEHPPLGYAEIHRNRRVRSPDHGLSARHSSIRQSKPDNTDSLRPASRKLPARPDRSPSTRISIRPVTAHSRSTEIESEEPRPVPARRLSRPRTAKANVNPVYTEAVSQNVLEYSTSDNTSTLPPAISPRENLTSRVDSKPITSALSPRQSQDPSSQSMTSIPRYVPMAPKQRACIVPRSPRVVTVTSSSKKLNASVVDRLNDFSSVLPYTSAGNSVNKQTNEIPMVLQSQQTPDHVRETSTHPTHCPSGQRAHASNGDYDTPPGNQYNNTYMSQNHDPVVDDHPKPDSHTTSYQQQIQQTSIPRPGSARPRAPAQASNRSSPQNDNVSSATDFRNTLSRSYDTQEHVISAKPPRPMQRPTTARTHVSVGDPPATKRNIPRPRTARMLPSTPQHRPQLEKYPTNTGQDHVVAQAIVHSPRPPTAPAERRRQVPDQTEYVTHDATVPAPSRIAVRTKIPKKPSLKFHFDSHKIVTENNAKEPDVTLPSKVYSSFEEAMTEYLERVAAENIFSKNVLHGFRQSLIKLEKLKFSKIEDKMTLFLNKMDEYLERSGKVIPEWFKPLRFRKTFEEPTVVTFDPATYFKNRRKCKYQHNKAAFERQAKKDPDPNVAWNGINKCRYLRIPNEMIDHSGMRTLGTDQIQLMKTLKGID